jgi:hypothetical protein
MCEPEEIGLMTLNFFFLMNFEDIDRLEKRKNMWIEEEKCSLTLSS